MIDNWAEGVNGPPSYSTPNATVQALVQSNLAAHLHHTARSETLYAILVEGMGPLGSVFSRDDFSDREVKDTDGDGLPEFVDAWGQPLQFFRWPLLYHTDTQRGQVIDYCDYMQSSLHRATSSSSTRRISRSSRPASRTRWTPTSSSWRRPGGRPRRTATRLDSPVPQGRSAAAAGCWPSSTSSTGSPSLSRIMAPRQFYWDRGTSSLRLAAGPSSPNPDSLCGPDQQPGIFLYPDSPSLPPNATQLLAVENNAMPYLFDFTAAVQVPSTTSTLPSGPYISSAPGDSSYPTYQLRENGRDDISNQNRQATGGLGGS